MGTTPIPLNPNTHAPYVLTHMVPPNNGAPSIPDGPPTMLPNGPLLLLDNVVLIGNGPEQTILLAGENIYGGWIVSPNGHLQSGAVVATANWWAAYGVGLASYPDGFFSHKVFVRSLSIDCQGQRGVNAGVPSHVLNLSGVAIANPALHLAADGITPVGQLSDATLYLHATQNCGADNVWVYDGNVEGILLDGTRDSNAQTNGPLPQSFQQSVAGTATFSPNTLLHPNPTSIATTHNVPVVNGFITKCHVDLNYPVWLAGSPSSAGGGSKGRLPIQVIGCATVVVASNRVGQRNQPSNFPPPLPNFTNPATVSPNTDIAINCPGAWHTLIFDNLLTCCSSGVASDGNGDMILACNVMYNFGGVGFISSSTTGKAASQTIVFGNTIFLGSGFGLPQQGIAILDAIPPIQTPAGEAATATPGSLVIANNVIYGCAYDIMLELAVIGATVTGNVFDFAGVQPQNQPNPGMGTNGGTTGNPPVWPAPNGSAIRIEGNDIIIRGNIFRNAGIPGTPNTSAIGINFPPNFPPNVAPDTIRVLVEGNIFDKTIGVPVRDNSSGSDGLLGVRILDNIGVNPAGMLNATLVPVPAPGTPFANPYPYDCFVTIAAGTVIVSGVTLYGVATGAKILANNQKSFLVKAGGTIAVSYPAPPAPKPTWVWVGM